MHEQRADASATSSGGERALRHLLRRLHDGRAIARTAIEIQQIPAPTFEEQGRSDEVLRRFQAIGLADASQDELGNVYGRRAGHSQRPGLLLAAHLDTVFPRGTDLSVRHEANRLYGPGIGDNSLGVAALLRLAAALQAIEAPNDADIWFVADVGEEGLGDLRGMRAAVDRLADRVGAVIAVEGSGFGRVYHRAIAVRRLRIAVHGPGGHSWADYGTPSAIHELVKLAMTLTELSVPAEPRTSLNIGVIQGGTSVNAIAEQASLLLDLRSEEPTTLNALEQAVRQALQAAPLPPSVEQSVTVVGAREGGAILESHPLPQAAAEALRAVGAAIEWGSGSTDANVPLSRGIPAICIGITTGGNAHRLDEYIELADIPRGMEALARTVWRLTCPSDSD